MQNTYIIFFLGLQEIGELSKHASRFVFVILALTSHTAYETRMS